MRTSMLRLCLLKNSCGQQRGAHARMQAAEQVEQARCWRPAKYMGSTVAPGDADQSGDAAGSIPGPSWRVLSDSVRNFAGRENTSAIRLVSATRWRPSALCDWRGRLCSPPYGSTKMHSRAGFGHARPADGSPGPSRPGVRTETMTAGSRLRSIQRDDWPPPPPGLAWESAPGRASETCVRTLSSASGWSAIRRLSAPGTSSQSRSKRSSRSSFSMAPSTGAGSFCPNNVARASRIHKHNSTEM